MNLPHLPWELWGVLASLFLALQIHLNQQFTLPPLVLGGARAIFALLLGMPLVFMIPADLPWTFYAGAVVVGICGQSGDLLMFRAAGIHGGRLASLYQPMKIWFIFIAWFILSAQTRSDLLHHPFTLLGIIILLIIGSYGIFALRRSDANLSAIPALIPPAGLFMVCDVIGKSVLEPDLVIAYTGLLLVIQNAFSLILLMFCKRKAFILQPRTWLAGFFAGIIWIGLVLTAVSCLEAAPNPAYLGVFSLLSIVWIFAYNRLKGLAPRTNWWAVLLILASAVGIALLR